MQVLVCPGCYAQRMKVYQLDNFCLWNLCRLVQLHQYSQMGVDEKWFGSHQRINCSVKSPMMVLSKSTWTNALENARETIHCAAYFAFSYFRMSEMSNESNESVTICKCWVIVGWSIGLHPTACTITNQAFVLYLPPKAWDAILILQNIGCLVDEAIVSVCN